MKVKLLSQDSIIPAQKREGDAAYDCYASKGTLIRVGETALVPLGFAIELDGKYGALIMGRSGNERDGLQCRTGVIDSNYRGEVKAMITNNSLHDYFVETHERIAQMLIVPLFTDKLTLVTALSDTNRGVDGFGSSGKK